MSLEDVKRLLLVASGSFALISVAISSWLALKEYRLKLQAEARAANSEKAETDVRLLKMFTELMESWRIIDRLRKPANHFDHSGMGKTSTRVEGRVA